MEYANKIGDYTLHHRPVKTRGTLLPGQGADGYGKKITTEIVLKFKNENRERRVYCTCFSNSGTHWIVYKGRQVYLPTHFQSEVQD